jgi:D-ribose pyranose/furanose isomerase RbsD
MEEVNAIIEALTTVIASANATINNLQVARALPAAEVHKQTKENSEHLLLDLYMVRQASLGYGHSNKYSVEHTQFHQVIWKEGSCSSFSKAILFDIIRATVSTHTLTMQNCNISEQNIEIIHKLFLSIARTVVRHFKQNHSSVSSKPYSQLCSGYKCELLVEFLNKGAIYALFINDVQFKAARYYIERKWQG